ncbi:HAD-superfamily hydrolase, subfamily IA, variant 3 [Pseudopedobacter saltans DSM 12145]|uniref:HAD-superfamily hydrolase, subfamily IA, variant 3 n=1 Tax=Pseudopedobacter saltans (strain ATCC 51119 / DSM 12145 / JCM 21818 / CCUG 39354 / LMG 10337 / NBRC 100064 / NCIMB 13643) TaxID=762903 RepID=F0S5K6_PSESL|nr:HAD family phosphatase [Pseudopedobacter saltans]ADY54180.1 HAD-superfamily hydrolase, subfamily IA, variant 3 [Pseudopedobacter saltans DSM 12145]
MKYEAYLFDLNGTIIDDMHFHARAWESILNKDLGANLTYDEVVLQMYGKNAELLERVFGKGHFTQEEMDRISLDKEKRYQDEFRPHLKLIDGLDMFLEKAYQAGIKMAIGSAAIPFNIDFVLDNLNLRKYFGAIVSADDVHKSKPDPETFTKAAEQLDIPFERCLVFEDAPKGIEAAQNATMDALCITTLHPEEDFKQYNNVVKFIADYRGLPLL